MNENFPVGSDDGSDLRIKKKKEREHQIRGRVMKAVLILTAAVLAFVLYARLAPNRHRISAQEYYSFMVQREGGPEELAEDELAVVLFDHVDARPACLVDGVLYLPYELVRQSLNSRFFLDGENGMVLFTTAYETYEIPAGSRTYTIDGVEQTYEHVIFLSDERGQYLSAAFVLGFTDALLWEVSAQEAQEARHIRIDYDRGTAVSAVLKKDTALRFSGSRKARIVTDGAKGEPVYVLEEFGKWTRVVTEDGYIGYVPSGRLSQTEESPYAGTGNAQEYPDLVSGEKINLIWHQIGVPESNDYLKQDTADMTGVNVISPTWFSLSDNEGNFISYATKTYVRQAHAMGLQVWGLVSNFSADMSTTQMLSHTSARRHLVEGLIEEAEKCGMDGINVDLELIAEEAGYAYVQLIRELSIACRKEGLVLSVDVPVPMSFNQYYDRKELGTVADYVIIMGYDEHYVGSDAGSVASLPFEENGIIETLREVPARKIISGVPFYTRLWFSQTDGDGNESVWSDLLGMNSATATLETYGVQAQWDDSVGQYYAEWTLDDGILCRIWMEEEESITLKAGLVKTYELGGIAEWALGSERSSIWGIISEEIE